MLPILTLGTCTIVTMQFWFKKSFKMFLVLIVVWFVSILTLLKYPLPGFGESLTPASHTETTEMDGKTKFEETLRRIDGSNKGDRKINKSRSAFRGKFLCKDAFLCLLSYNPTNDM